jgi:hypothetical protein
MGQKYSLKISAVLKSRYNNSTVYESQLSKDEIFIVNPGLIMILNLAYLILENCLLQSSICTPTNQNCEAIAVVGRVHPSTHGASLFLLFLGVVSFGFTFILIIIYFKRYEVFSFIYISFRRCIWVKKMLKKADKASNVHETISLVYGNY